MDRLAAYQAFAAIGREHSFSAAARRLRVSPQAVTRAIAALEERLGVRLLHRTTRAVSLTNEGAELLPRIERILRDLEDGERAMAGTQIEPRGELTVTAPVAFGQIHVMPALTSLLAAHPDLDIHLLLIDRNVRLVEEGIDVAVRIGALPDSNMRAVRIGSVSRVFVASPAYLARMGAPSLPADLARHDLVSSTGPRSGGEWRFGESGEPARLRRRIRVNTVGAALAAAEAGVGIANLLSYQAAEGLASGRLVEVLRPQNVDPIPVNLVFEPGRSSSAAARTFIEAMRQRAREGRWA